MIPALLASAAQNFTDQLTAVDLLTGIVLAITLFLLRGQVLMGGILRGIEERLRHLPTRKEVTDEVGATRHLLRNETQALTLELEGRLTKLERGAP